MARYSSTQKARTRVEIVEKAAAIVREVGLEGTGVAQVMKAAGLTHGGFYAHFSSKEELLESAVQQAISVSPGRFAMLVEKAREADDPGLIARRYLSADRVDDVANGCAAAALASEMHRAPVAVRDAFEAGAVATAGALGELTRRETDWASYAMLVGALSLIRAMPDPNTGEEIRNQVAAALARLAVPFSDPSQK